jgi:hypothetical protein
MEVEAATYWLAWVRFGQLIAVFLVAIGVVAEFAGEYLSRSLERPIEAAREERLATLANEATSARAAIAEANARAAQGNQKAQEASLELAKFKAPRELTQEQREQIVGELKQFPGTEYDIAISSIDPEILGFVDIIEPILLAAGWVPLDWAGPGTAQVLRRSGLRPIINVSASVTNVMIGVHVNQPPKFLESARVLSAALMAAGVAASARELIVGPGSSTNANAILIFAIHGATASRSSAMTMSNSPRLPTSSVAWV